MLSYGIFTFGKDLELVLKNGFIDEDIQSILILITVDSRYYEPTKCKPNPFIIRQFFKHYFYGSRAQKNQKLFII
jgi:hypothetical protein